jgi:hypothetical protein
MQSPASGKLRESKARSSTRRRTITHVVVVVSLMLGGLAAGTLLTLHIQGRPAPPPPAVNTSTASNSVGTIRFPTDREPCRELQIDNQTWRIEKRRVDECKEIQIPTDPNEIVRNRYSNGRLDTIRDSFKGR